MRTVEVIGPISECLRRLPKLVDVSLDSIGHASETINALAGLQNLSSLTLDWSDVDKPEEHQRYDYPSPQVNEDQCRKMLFEPQLVSRQCSRRSFQALRVLALASSFEFCTALLTHCAPALTSLWLSSEVAPTGQPVVSAWSSTLATCCPNLTDIGLILQGVLPADLWRSFQPLLHLQVHRFSVQCPEIQELFTLRDSDLLSIAKAWSDLEALSLSIYSQEQQQEPTLTAALSIARYCPALQEVLIGTLYPGPEMHSGPLPRSDTLTQFVVEDSYVDSASLAKFVAAVWPNAVVTGPDESDHINELLEMARYVRRVDQEREEVSQRN